MKQQESPIKVTETFYMSKWDWGLDIIFTGDEWKIYKKNSSLISIQNFPDENAADRAIQQQALSWKRS